MTTVPASREEIEHALTILARSSDRRHWEIVIRDPKSPAEAMIALLGQDFDDRMYFQCLQHPSLPPCCIEKIAETEQAHDLILRRNLPEERVFEICKRWGVVGVDSRLDPFTMILDRQGKSLALEEMLYEALSNMKVGKKGWNNGDDLHAHFHFARGSEHGQILERLSHYRESDVRCNVVYNPHTPLEVWTSMSDDPCDDVRQAVAERLRQTDVVDILAALG